MISSPHEFFLFFTGERLAVDGNFAGLSPPDRRAVGSYGLYCRYHLREERDDLLKVAGPTCLHLAENRRQASSILFDPRNFILAV